MHNQKEKRLELDLKPPKIAAWLCAMQRIQKFMLR
jgi:hypothetical protein